MGLAPQPFGKRPMEQSSSSGQLATRRPRSRRRPLAGRLEARQAQASAATSERVLRSDRARVDHFLPWIVFFGSFAFILLKAPGLDYFLSSRDHGYQLSIGSQVLMGKVPGIDVIISYGPLAMYTSSVGLWASGSLIGETVFCGRLLGLLTPRLPTGRGLLVPDGRRRGGRLRPPPTITFL